MKKNNLDIRLILIWFITIITITACKAQQDSSAKQNYEPYTEHQYYIKPVNDTLLTYFFKTTIPQNNIIRNNDGKIFLEVSIDTAGNVIEVVFEKTDKIILEEHTKKNLSDKIRDKIKYEVAEDAKNYYAILNNPITAVH